MKEDIFISYSTKDSEKIDLIVREFEGSAKIQSGCDCYK